MRRPTSRRVSLNLCECGFRVARSLLLHFCSRPQGHRESIFKRSGCRVAKIALNHAVLGPAVSISGGPPSASVRLCEKSRLASRADGGWFELLVPAANSGRGPAAVRAIRIALVGQTFKDPVYAAQYRDHFGAPCNCNRLGRHGRLAAENPLPERALSFRDQRAPLVRQKLDGAGLILEQF